MPVPVVPSQRTAPSAAGAVAFAATVVLVELALVAAWVWFLTVDDGLTRILWAALGALLFWRLLPRPLRLAARTEVVPEADAPTLHRLVREVAERVGARPPEHVAVDTTYPVLLVPLGYLGRATLVVGLPQWTALDAGERVAVLAHELACVDVRRRPSGCLVRLADDLLTSVRTVLTPTAVVTADVVAIEQSTATMGVYGPGDELAGNRMRREASAAVGAAGMSVVGAPVRAAQSLLGRLWRPVTEAGALRADWLAAGLAGRRAAVGALLSTVGVPRGLVAAQNAARTAGGDPFAAIVAAPRPDRDELDRRAAGELADTVASGHPSTGRRVAALEAGTAGAGGATGDAPTSPGAVDLALVAAADRELDTWRSRLRPRFTEELLHGRP